MEKLSPFVQGKGGPWRAIASQSEWSNSLTPAASSVLRNKPIKTQHLCKIRGTVWNVCQNLTGFQIGAKAQRIQTHKGDTGTPHSTVIPLFDKVLGF